MALTKSLPKTQPFEIRRSQIQGLGGYATRAIRKGARIGEYVGERISQAESDRRYDDEGMARHHTFLFTVSSRTVIDGAIGGNDTKFINHSCAPNCEAVIEGGRVFIDALRSIPAGTELYYDYAYERDEDAGPEAEALYICLCGAATCRGTILAPPARKRRKQPTRSSNSRPRRSRKPSRVNLSSDRPQRGSAVNQSSKSSSRTTSKRSSKRSSKKPVRTRPSAARPA